MKGNVYFISNGSKFYGEHSKNLHIKIGFSKSPQRRLIELQTSNSNPCKLLHCIENASIDIENLLHYHFRESRTNGEWFWHPPILKFIDFIERKTTQEVIEYLRDVESLKFFELEIKSDKSDSRLELLNQGWVTRQRKYNFSALDFGGGIDGYNKFKDNVFEAEREVGNQKRIRQAEKIKGNLILELVHKHIENLLQTKGLKEYPSFDEYKKITQEITDCYQ